jgi:hypothetical protein
MTPDRGIPRLGRTLVFAVAAIGLAVGGHTAGGGGLPHPAVYPLVLAPVLLLSLWLSGRRRGMTSLLSTLSLLQVVLHVIFHVSHAAHTSHAGHTGPTGHTLTGPLTGTLTGPLTGTGHGPHAQLRNLAAAYPSGVDAMAGVLPSPSMLAGHLVAVLTTAWLMTRGEASLWRVVHRLRVTLWPTPWAAVTPHLAQCPAISVDQRLEVSRGAGRALATRGPPVPASA